MPLIQPWFRSAEIHWNPLEHQGLMSVLKHSQFEIGFLVDKFVGLDFKMISLNFTHL